MWGVAKLLSWMLAGCNQTLLWRIRRRYRRQTTKLRRDLQPGAARTKIWDQRQIQQQKGRHLIVEHFPDLSFGHPCNIILIIVFIVTILQLLQVPLTAIGKWWQRFIWVIDLDSVHLLDLRGRLALRWKFWTCRKIVIFMKIVDNYTPL